MLSAIFFIHILSFKLSKSSIIELEPVVKLLYQNLIEHEENDLTKENKIENLEESSVLEVSSFSNKYGINLILNEHKLSNVLY